MTSTCLVCGEVVTEDIPALGHDETNAIWEETEGATCITEGVRSFICQRLIGDEICDEVIFEEFKGTGNLEIRLDRELSERRIYPAISLSQSGTRNDDRLYNEQEFVKIMQLRRQLAMKPGWEGLQTLLQNISKTQNNAELLLTGLR